MATVNPVADLGELLITKIYRKHKGKKYISRVGNGEVFQDDEYKTAIKTVRWLKLDGKRYLEREIEQARAAGDNGREDRMRVFQRDLEDDSIDLSTVVLGPAKKDPPNSYRERI
jgi:hypothetical protein